MSLPGAKWEASPSGNLVDVFNNSIIEDGWFLYISATGITSPWGVFAEFPVLQCVNLECTVYDPVYPVALNDPQSGLLPGEE